MRPRVDHCFQKDMQSPRAFTELGVQSLNVYSLTLLPGVRDTIPCDNWGIIRQKTGTNQRYRARLSVIHDSIDLRLNRHDY